MCNGKPCGCCRPVKRFDTHFDDPKVWKCLFQDMRENHAIDLTPMQSVALGIGSLENIRSFVQDYRFPGARPILTPPAASFYTPPTAIGIGSSTRTSKCLMARMKFDQPDPEDWQPQRITILVKYDYQLDYPESGLVRGNVIEIIIGDEHDDPSQTYSSIYNCWPALAFRISQGQTYTDRPNEGFMFANLLAPEGAFTGAFSGYQLAAVPPGSSPNLDIPNAAEIELTIERLPTSTRFRCTIDGVPAGLTATLVADRVEWLEIPHVIFRESPNWRFMVSGMQFEPTTSHRVPAKFDRIAVKSELIPP